MKTIFITSFHSLISRNILQTEVLLSLREKGLRIVLLVPEQKVSFFQETFGDSQVIVEGVSVPKKHFENIIYFMSLSLVGVNNHVIDDLKTEGFYFKYYAAHFIHLFSPFFFLHELMRFIANTYLRTDAFGALFEKYNPSLVFVTDSFYREDRALLTTAHSRKIPSVGMVRSWDNATTKGVLLAEPDSFIVPNKVLYEEMVTIHHIDSQKINVTGLPHYDAVSGSSKMSRESFLLSLGLDPNKKTILFAPGGKILYKHDGVILKLLQEHLDSGDFVEPVQFLVRLPPGDSIDSESIKEDKRFVVDKPGVDITGRRKENELTVKDNEHLNNSIVHSDTVVTLVSTMVIDGTVFQKPVIVIGFDPAEGLVDSVCKFSKCTHFKKLIDSNLVKVSKNDSEFVTDINNALTNPDHNQKDRDRLISLYAYKLDGGSAGRVVHVLLNNLLSQ